MRIAAHPTAATPTLLTTLIAVGVSAAPASAAAEVHPRPASGTYSVAGHGWGHGRGLNQWGAQGAALAGVLAPQILSTYYPGTTAAVQADTPIRVHLSEDEGTDVQVHPRTLLAVRDVTSTLRQVLPTSVPTSTGTRSVTLWRALRAGSGTRLEAFTSTGWVRYGVAGRATLPGAVRFEGPSRIRVTLGTSTVREYRGSISAVPVTGTSTLAAVNTLSREGYLKGVVPKEAIPSWHQEALRAQAVAARTYTAYKQARTTSTQWDICSTTACQVYQGATTVTTTATGTTLVSHEYPSTTAAVDATRGQVRTYLGNPILAEFSSSNGGMSTASSLPYQQARVDPWDALRSPHHRWSGAVSAAEVEKHWPGVGRLERIVILSRDGRGEWGGRVLQMRLEGTSSTGTATSVTLTGSAFTSKLAWPTKRDGLRHSWFQLAPSV